jgi:hypothetical protein
VPWTVGTDRRSPRLLPQFPAQPSRSSRWSPTRMALAIAARAGLTALMLGKKLVSTTERLSSSWVRQSVASTNVAGSEPNRTVPAWYAQPAIGSRFHVREPVSQVARAACEASPASNGTGRTAARRPWDCSACTPDGRRRPGRKPLCLVGGAVFSLVGRRGRSSAARWRCRRYWRGSRDASRPRSLPASSSGCRRHWRWSVSGSSARL